jgi:hypothetical protein
LVPIDAVADANHSALRETTVHLISCGAEDEEVDAVVALVEVEARRAEADRCVAPETDQNAEVGVVADPGTISDRLHRTRKMIAPKPNAESGAANLPGQGPRSSHSTSNATSASCFWRILGKCL